MSPEMVTMSLIETKMFKDHFFPGADNTNDRDASFKVFKLVNINDIVNITGDNIIEGILYLTSQKVSYFGGKSKYFEYLEGFREKAKQSYNNHNRRVQVFHIVRYE